MRAMGDNHIGTQRQTCRLLSGVPSVPTEHPVTIKFLIIGHGHLNLAKVNAGVVM